MGTNNTSHRSHVAHTIQTKWVTAAILIVTLLLGAFAGIPRVAAASDGIQRGIDADAARYQAMGESYMAIQRGIDAGAARYQAMGGSYMAKAGDDLLAANPELMFARRSYGAAASLLATNPELMVARQAYKTGALGCAIGGEDLAANPELAFARQARGC
jgi:hypothetical protein